MCVVIHSTKQCCERWKIAAEVNKKKGWRSSASLCYELKLRNDENVSLTMQPSCRRHELALLQRLIRNDQRRIVSNRQDSPGIGLGVKGQSRYRTNILVQAQEWIERRL